MPKTIHNSILLDRDAPSLLLTNKRAGHAPVAVQESHWLFSAGDHKSILLETVSCLSEDLP